MARENTPIPSYQKPPIIEAVWSVQFAELKWLRPASTGLYWNRILDRFPGCEERPPIPHVVEGPQILAAPQGTTEVVTIPPLSRQWFVSRSENELVQLQRDRFCCNWRKVGASDVYPRFQHMRELFKSTWQSFCDFVAEGGETSPSVDQCEMTYINHIEQGQGWETIDQVGQVFPAVRWEGEASYLQAPETLSAGFAFPLPELGGRLHAWVRHGMTTERASGPRQILVLELTARGVPTRTDMPSLLDWYAKARESIVRAFTDLTHKRMHTLWEREK